MVLWNSVIIRDGVNNSLFGHHLFCMYNFFYSFCIILLHFIPRTVESAPQLDAAQVEKLSCQVVLDAAVKGIN